MKTSLATITILAVSLSLAVSCGGTDSADKPAAPAPSTQADTQTTPAETAATAAAPAASEQAATTSPGQGAESAPTETTPTETAGSTSHGSPQGSPQASSPASAAPVTQRELGEIVFAEGSVSIHRAGAQPEAADIGSIVRQYDVLVTGPKSRAEVDLGSGSAGGASVKLTENTAFYFDTKELGEAERKTVLQLLTGALAIKVDKLANGSFSVATEQAVLGVRGTVFIVDTVPDGSLLVTCDSGAVAVSADGSTTTAKPGAVVELPQAGDLRLLAVEPADLSSYRGEWRVDAYKSFASRALSYTSAYAATIESGKPAFEAALAKLDAQKPALDAWRTARAAGRQPRFTDWIAEKKAVSAALFDCLKALFSLERPYYRLMELKALHASGTGVGTLKDGRSSAAYFAGFDSANASLALGMARVREALLLFSWVSEGSPLGEFFGAKAESLGTGALFIED